VSWFSQALDWRTIQFVTSLSRCFPDYSVVMLGLYSAAAGRNSEAALTLDDSNALRSLAKAVEAINIAAIPRVARRYLDISTS
jgi:hypothetical protein